MKRTLSNISKTQPNQQKENKNDDKRMSRKRPTNSQPTPGPSKKRTLTEFNPPPSPSASVLSDHIQRSDYQRSGKVIRIVLKNFMCHSNLKVEFNSRVNLLVGNNGSGKSAILTALIIGLGCKASTSNRSSNITQLIKRGERSGSIEIHLSNNEKTGYEYTKYGSKVIVIRSFSTTGDSKYVVKSADGNVISRSVKDLLRVLMHFNIQVDNPVCILTQDAARSFLKDSDPKIRFKLFLKATQLDVIIEKLNFCVPKLKELKWVHKQQLARLQKLKETCEQTETMYNRLQSVDKIKDAVKQLKKEEAWLIHSNEENLTINIKNTLDDVQKTFDKLNKNFSDGDSFKNKIREVMDQIKAQINTNEQGLTVDKEQFNAIQGTLKKMSADHQKCSSMQNKAMQKLDRCRNDIGQLQTEIAERERGKQSGVAKLKAENDAKIESKSQKKDDFEVMHKNAKRDIELLNNTKNEVHHQFNDMCHQRKNILESMNKVNNELTKYDSASTNQDALLVYGRHMPKMVAEIEKLYKAGKFSEMPRGPLGRYIEVTDEKWKVCIEGIIGPGIMQAFCVNNAKDHGVLYNMITRLFPEAKQTSIITTKFIKKVYDVRRGQVLPEKDSILAMDVIKVSDPVVMNCIIDQCNIETILLVENDDIAMHLTSDERTVPKNLSRVIVKEPYSEFYPEPNYRSYSNKQRHAKYLQVNFAQRIAYLKEELHSWNTKKVHIEKELTKVQTKLNELTKQLSGKNERISNWENEMRLLNQQIAELKAVEYQEDEIEFLQNEKVELEQNLRENEQILIDKTEETKKIAHSMEIQETKLNELKDKIQQKEIQIRRLLTTHDEKKHKLERSNMNAKHEEAELKIIELDIQKMNAEYIAAMEKTKRLEDVAKKFGGEKVQPSGTIEEIKKKIRSNERSIHEISQSNLTLDETKLKLESQKMDLNDLTLRCDFMKLTLKTMNSTLRKRFDNVKTLKGHMSLRVKHSFQNLLKLRNFEGTLEIDHDTETLNMSIVPRDKHIKNAVSNAKCLSGGERSFTTVAFLLALWTCVDSPIFFLDEYDVFTDQVNRYYITKLLIGEANKKPQRQYSFLTPQDISDISPTDNLTIHRLANPERN